MPATTPAIETAGGRPDAGQDRRPVRRVAGGDRARREDGFRRGGGGGGAGARDHRRRPGAGRPVSGHIYGRDFVAAYAASGVTDTHEAIDRDIADDLLEAGLWIFLRGGPPTTPGTPCPRPSARSPSTARPGSGSAPAPMTATPTISSPTAWTGWCGRRRHGASRKPQHGRWARCIRDPIRARRRDRRLGGGRRADLVLLDDDLVPQATWYGGELVVEGRKATPRLEAALAHPTAIRRPPMPRCACPTRCPPWCRRCRPAPAPSTRSGRPCPASN